jgi:hypothetical protein
MLDRTEDTNDGAWFRAPLGRLLVLQAAKVDDVGAKPYAKVRKREGYVTLCLAWFHRAVWIGVRYAR